MSQSQLDGAREHQHLGYMPKRKDPEPTPAEQYKRFKKAAHKAGVTESEKEFERSFKTIARSKLSQNNRKTRKRD